MALRESKRRSHAKLPQFHEPKTGSVRTPDSAGAFCPKASFVELA
jgi:hypothetical protein